MAQNSFPKGCLLSSTPLQSPEDSGYFGSGQRRYKSNANILSSCSPIKESTYKNIPENSPLKREFCEIPAQFKFEKNLDFENLTKNVSLSGIEINELSELEFASSNFSSQCELSKTSPSLPEEEQKFHDLLYKSYKDTRDTRHLFHILSKDSDINYKLFEYESSDLTSSNDFKYSKYLNELSASTEYKKCDFRKKVSIFKQTKIDFIHELNKRNCFSIISFILSCLSAKELCIASCISKEWNKVILYDPKANSRRETFITERVTFLNGPSKENRRGMKYGPAKEHKTAFSSLTNINIAPHPVNAKVSSTKFDSFVKEAKNAKSKCLLKCPRCSYCSKCLDGNNYICTQCSYKFCSRCLTPIFRNHTCSTSILKPQLPNIFVGSKKSRKNLRRL